MKIEWKERGRSMCGGGKLRNEFTAAGKLGKDCEAESAYLIEAGYNYNGSGAKHFGGAPSWPVVKAKFAFQEGQEKERDEFVDALKAFVVSYFASKEGVPLKDVPKWKRKLAEERLARERLELHSQEVLNSY